MDKLVLSDYHGTWDSHPEIWGQVKAIVTGTAWFKSFNVLDEWVGPSKPIFFNPLEIGEGYTLLNTSGHKADIINKLHATEYYENDEEQVRMLKILCPDTRIILVRGGETVI